MDEGATTRVLSDVGATAPLTEAVPAPAVGTPPPSARGPLPGAALLARAAEIPVHLRNAGIAVAAIVLLIVIAGFASDSSGGSVPSDGGADDPIPAKTPPDLRDPVQDLHDAVLGTGQ